MVKRYLFVVGVLLSIAPTDTSSASSSALALVGGSQRVISLSTPYIDNVLSASSAMQTSSAQVEDQDKLHTSTDHNDQISAEDQGPQDIRSNLERDDTDDKVEQIKDIIKHINTVIGASDASINICNIGSKYFNITASEKNLDRRSNESSHEFKMRINSILDEGNLVNQKIEGLISSMSVNIVRSGYGGNSSSSRVPGTQPHPTGFPISYAPDSNREVAQASASASSAAVPISASTSAAIGRSAINQAASAAHVSFAPASPAATSVARDTR